MEMTSLSCGNTSWFHTLLLKAALLEIFNLIVYIVDHINFGPFPQPLRWVQLPDWVGCPLFHHSTCAAIMSHPLTALGRAHKL
jgi:hypothetical protein